MSRGRTDANQQEIINALRAIGCSVFDASQFGAGFTDLVVGRVGVNWLMEVKDGSKPLSAQALTKDQKKFHDEWRGQKAVVRSAEEAIAIVLEYAR